MTATVDVSFHAQMAIHDYLKVHYSTARKNEIGASMNRRGTDLQGNSPIWKDDIHCFSFIHSEIKFTHPLMDNNDAFLHVHDPIVHRVRCSIDVDLAVISIQVVIHTLYSKYPKE